MTICGRIKSAWTSRQTRTPVWTRKRKIIWMTIWRRCGRSPGRRTGSGRRLPFAMAGDADAIKRLAELMLPEVPQIARLYTGQGVSLEDLIGEGNVALSLGVTMLGALEHADEAQGMLAKMMMDAMEDCIAVNAAEEKSDRKIADKVNKVADAANALKEELRRAVTVEELMEESGLSRKAIEDAVRISGGKIESIAAE